MRWRHVRNARLRNRSTGRASVAKALAALAACVLAVSIAVICVSGAALAAAPSQPDPRFAEFSRYVINGATVFFRRVEVDKAGIVAVMRAGTGNQRPDEAHCAHMAEHMVLAYPNKSGTSVVSAAGGFMSGTQYNVQGGTLADSTGFIISVANAEVPDMLSLLFDSMFRTTLREDDDFVAETKRARRELDNITTKPVHALANKLRVNAYLGTPYEERFFETPLQAVTAEQIRAFMEREYTPARLILAIVADIDEQIALTAVETGLAGLEPGQGPAMQEIRLPSIEPEALELPKVDKPSIGIAVGVDGLVERDLVPLGRLFSALRKRLHLSESVAGFRFNPDFVSSFSAQDTEVVCLEYSSAVASGDADEVMDAVPQVLSAVRDVLLTLAEEGPNRGDLSELVTPGQKQMQIASSQAFTKACAEAMGVANLAALGDTAGSTSETLGSQGTEAETLAEMKAVAAKYFPEAKLTAVYTIQASPSGVSTVAMVAVVLIVAISGYVFYRRGSAASE
ncbi:MAG: M16 family metallopeptidase [Bacillota bacterium]